MKKMQGKVVVIIGGSGGIGGVMAAVLAQAGASVVICARGRQKLEAVVQQINLDRVVIEPLDAADPDAVEDMLCRVKEKFGRMDCIVLSAGTWKLVNINTDLKDALELKRILWKSIVEPAYVPALAAQKLFRDQDGGFLIINMSSHVVERPWLPNNLAYIMAKSAVDSFITALRHELGEKVRLTNLRPAIVNTPDNVGLLNTEEKRLGAVQPEELAQWVVDHMDDPAPPAEKLFDSSVVL